MIKSENSPQRCESGHWAEGSSMNQLHLDSAARGYATAPGDIARRSK